MFKIFKKAICANCKHKQTCDDVPGFCLLLPYFAVASIVLLLIYFIANSKL